MNKPNHIMSTLMLLALTFTACSDDLTSESEIKYSSVPLGFSCEDNITRGSQTNNISEFVVHSLYYNEGSSYGRYFFEGQIINFNETTHDWTYSPLKYWPKSGVLDFYAYSPKGIKGLESLTLNHTVYPAWLMKYYVPNPVITTINELSGTTISTDVFNKAKDAENQQDLLLATKLNEVCTEQTALDRYVSLKFIHPLAGLQLQFNSGYTFPTNTSHVIIAIAPLCTGGTIALDKSTSSTTPDLTWTLDESEATFYQGYTITSGQIDSDTKTFFLPPQQLKNFTITARFYKQENGTYTLLGTKTSTKNSLTLTQGKTTTINITTTTTP